MISYFAIPVLQKRSGCLVQEGFVRHLQNREAVIITAQVNPSQIL